MGALTRLMGAPDTKGGSGSDPDAGKNRGAISDIVSSLRKRGKSSSTSSPGTDDPGAPSYHRGGKVRKTGPARLKKGETVLTKTQMRKMRSNSRGKGKGKRRGAKSR